MTWYGNQKIAGVALMIVVTWIASGCRTQDPMGLPVEPETLGASLDVINQTQEENAERAKMIVYAHEFEMNQSPIALPEGSNLDLLQDFQFVKPLHVRGFRITPFGQDHVRQIANQILNNRDMDSNSSSNGPLVIVERSRTSRYWSTQHRFPVHFNDELDEFRRRMVVRVLEQHGISDAEQLVIIAPAYPEGLSGIEAANAYSRSFGNTQGAGNGQNGSSGVSSGSSGVTRF